MVILWCHGRGTQKGFPRVFITGLHSAFRSVACLTTGSFSIWMLNCSTHKEAASLHRTALYLVVHHLTILVCFCTPLCSVIGLRDCVLGHCHLLDPSVMLGFLEVSQAHGTVSLLYDIPSFLLVSSFLSIFSVPFSLVVSSCSFHPVVLVSLMWSSSLWWICIFCLELLCLYLTFWIQHALSTIVC